jgi:PAS domain S-box-containing protein
MGQYDGKTKRTLAVYVFIFLLLMMGIAISGYTSYRNYERESRHQAENQISAIAELKVNGLVEWRKERLADVEFLRHNPIFSALVERYLESPDDEEAHVQLLAWLGNYQVYGQYGWVFLLDATGAEKISVPDASDGIDARLVTDALASLHSGQVTFLDLRRYTNADGKIRIPILVPIFTEKGDNHPLGVLVLDIDPQIYLYPYIQNWPINSTSAETLLVRRDGQDVLFLNELRFRRDSALNLRFPLTDTDTPAVKAVMGQAGVVEGVDYRGEPVLADVRAVPDSPWFLVSKMDTAEAYAPLKTRLWQTLLIMGMAVFVAGTGLALVWKEQCLLFYRTQVETTEALRESEDKFKYVFDYSVVGKSITYPGGEVHLNKAFCDILGYSTEEMQGRKWQEVTHSDDIELTQSHIDLLVSGQKESTRFVKRFIHKNGSVVWVDLSSTIRRDQLNKPLYLMSTVIDITERKQMEESLRENETKFRSIIELSPAPYALNDKEKNIIYLNAAFTRTFGYDLNDIPTLAHWWQKAYPDPDYRRWATETWETRLDKSKAEGAEFESMEVNIHCKDDSVRTALVSAQSLGESLEGIHVVVFHDITERKQAEKALTKNEAMLKRVQEVSHMGSWEIDLATKMVIASDEAHRIYGVSQGDMTLAFIQSVSLLEYRPMLDAALNALIMEDGRYDVEFKIRRQSDGEVRDIHSIAEYNASNRTIIGSIQDITDRKQVETALLESEKRFHSLYDNATIGMYRTTPDGQVLLSNPAGIRMLGYDSFEELVERNLEEDDITAEFDRSQLHEKIKQEGAAIGIESAWKKKDGSTIYVRESATAVKDINGNILYYDGTFEDITERKQAGDALRESEALYRQAIEVAGAVPYLQSYTANGRGGVEVKYDFISEGIRQITGYGPEEFSDELWVSITQERVLLEELAGHSWHEAVQWVRSNAGAIWKCEHRILARDGKTHWVLESAVELRDENGVSHGSIGLYQDITERKLAENALRQSEAVYRQAIEVANAVPYHQIYNDRSDGGAEVEYDFIGEGIRQITGYGPEEFNEPLWDSITLDRFLLEELAEYSFNDAIQYVRSTENAIWKCEHCIRARDGKIHWVFEAAVELRDENGVSHGSIGLLQDITERKQAEEKMREKDIQFRKLSSNVPDLIFQFTRRLDGTYHVPVASEGIRNVFGCTPEDVSEDFAPIARVIFPEDSARVIGDIEYSAEHLTFFTCEFRVQIPGRPIQWVYSRSTPERLADGSITWYGFNTNITERKQAEEEIRKFNTELEQRVRERTLQLETANKELEAFSYSVSHDLRAPLRGIDGWSQALLEDYHDLLDEQGQKYIERVRSETQRMGYLIDDMLQLSRLTRAEMTRETVDLSDLALSIAGRLQAAKSMPQVDLNIQAGLIAKGDAHLLEIALTNLLDNAFKFTSKRADARIEFGQTELQGQYVFFVRDNGAGFNMAYSQKLFGVFQRMHKVSEFPGTGVGLAIVQRIIHRHGGRVWAEAEVGHGTVIYFTLEEKA